MSGWVKYLVYIMSFFIPPVGVITFWVFLGRGEELEDVAKWSFLAAGSIIYVVQTLVYTGLSSRKQGVFSIGLLAGLIAGIAIDLVISAAGI